MELAVRGASNRVKGAGAKPIIHPIEPGTYRRLPGWLKQKRIAAERVNNTEYGSRDTSMT